MSMNRKNKNALRITSAAIFLPLVAALALAALSCSKPAPAEPWARVTPEHVAEDEQAIVEWDFPKAEGVYINGAGRVISKGETTTNGMTPGVQEPHKPAGQMPVVPSEDANRPHIETFNVGGREYVKVPEADATPPPYNLFPVVSYEVSEAVLGDAAKFVRTATVTVHRRAPVTLAHVLQQKGEAVILDVRDARFFQVSDNIPASVNIPFAELSWRAGELPKDKTIIVSYIAGNPDGEREAWDAVRVLTKAGRRATVLRGGLEEWWQGVTNAKGRK